MLCIALKLNSQYVSSLLFILVITTSIYVLIGSILKLCNDNTIRVDWITRIGTLHENKKQKYPGFNYV